MGQPSTLKSRNWRSRKRNASPRIGCLVQIVVIGMFMAAAFVFFSPTSRPSLKGTGTGAGAGAGAGAGSEQHIQLPPLVKFYPSIKLPNEDSFTQTLRNCTSHKEKDCKQFIPKNNDHRQRIAILSPPGVAADLFFDVLKKAMLVYYDDSSELMNRNIELIKSSHVPPYGYGKTHGLTKIIRLINRPLLQEVAEATVSTIANSSSSTSPKTFHETIMNNPQLISNSLRQIVRWHCRLSHVAAHTLMYNIHLSSPPPSGASLGASSSENNGSNDDVLASRISEAVKVIRAGVGEDSSIVLGEDVPKMRKVDDFIANELKSKSSLSSSVQSSNQNDENDAGLIIKDVIHSNPHLLEEYQRVLQNELDSTNNLKKWPCPSFHWMEEGGQGQLPLVVGDGSTNNNWSSLLAKELSPDCNAPFTTCFVNKDKCEYRGDGLCKN